MSVKRPQVPSKEHIHGVARDLFLANKDLSKIPSSVADVAASLATQFTPELMPVVAQMNTKDATSISKILMFVPFVMAAVEKVSNMSDDDKKAAVMTAFKTIITALCPQDAVLLCLAIDTIIAPAVDMACLAVKQLASKLKKNNCFGLCGKSSSTSSSSAALLEKAIKKNSATITPLTPGSVTATPLSS